jgi:DNA-binding winged helix-turn-helix (wHTH) protein
MSDGTCPHCGRPLLAARLGVRLSPLKTRIFDALTRAGPDGIDADELFAMVFSGRAVLRTVLKSHVSQINDLLVETDFRIVGVRGQGRWYTLVHRKVEEAA